MNWRSDFTISSFDKRNIVKTKSNVIFHCSKSICIVWEKNGVENMNYSNQIAEYFEKNIWGKHNIHECTLTYPQNVMYYLASMTIVLSRCSGLRISLGLTRLSPLSNILWLRDHVIINYIYIYLCYLFKNITVFGIFLVWDQTHW